MNNSIGNVKIYNNDLRPLKRRRPTRGRRRPRRARPTRRRRPTRHRRPTRRRRLPHRGGRRGRRTRRGGDALAARGNQSYTNNESLGVLSPVDELGAQFELLMEFVNFFKNTDPDKLKGFSGLLNPKFFIDTLTESIDAFKKEIDSMSPDEMKKLENAIIKVENILKRSINTTAEEAGRDAGDIAYNTLLAALTPVPFVGPSLMILSAILDNSWMIFSFIAETRERIRRTILRITKIPGIGIVLRIVNTILTTIKNAIIDLPELKERVLERQAPPIMAPAAPQQSLAQQQQPLPQQQQPLPPQPIAN